MKRALLAVGFALSTLSLEVGAVEPRTPAGFPANQAAPLATDVSFTATSDGTVQRYVELPPPGFDEKLPHDVVIALHGHGSDRWQFIKDARGECKGVRNTAAKHGLIVVSPDYRAKTSWMGPKAEADVLQIIAELKQRRKIGRVFLAGGSMGGTAVLTFTALHPGLIAGVCSLNGTANLIEYERFQDARTESFGGSKAEVPEEYRKRSAELWPEKFTMPIAFTTGGRDDIVPPQSVLRLVEKLKQAGRRVLSIHREAGGHSTNYEDTCAAMEFMLREAGCASLREQEMRRAGLEQLEQRLADFWQPNLGEARRRVARMSPKPAGVGELRSSVEFLGKRRQP